MVVYVTKLDKSGVVRPKYNIFNQVGKVFFLYFQSKRALSTLNAEYNIGEIIALEKSI